MGPPRFDRRPPSGVVEKSWWAGARSELVPPYIRPSLKKALALLQPLIAIAASSTFSYNRVGSGGFIAMDLNAPELSVAESMVSGTILMSVLLRHQLLLGLIAGLVFFTNLGGYALFDEDEPKNAVCGREMFERGDWIVPTFNGTLRTDKPILIYWLMQTSFRLFGVSEFAARFGSSLLAVLTTLLTYHLGRKLFSPSEGFLAGLILCTSLMYSAVGRAVTPDAVLLFCLMLVFTSFAWVVSARRGGHFCGVGTTAQQTRWTDLLPATRIASLPMYAAMGLAVLAKGPIGVLLPCAIIGLFLLITRRNNDLVRGTLPFPVGPWWRRALTVVVQTMSPGRILTTGIAMRLVLGAVIVLTVALPWYVAVGMKTDGAWIRGFLGDHNIGRFLEPKENHHGPIFYYVVVLLMGCFPWSVFLPLAVWQLGRRLLQGGTYRDSDHFVSCWVGVWFVFFSCASTKLPNYVLPMYPALALMTARYLHDWRSAPVTTGAISFHHCCRALGAVGVLIMIAAPIAMSILLPGEEWLLVVGVVPLAGASLAYAASRHGRRAQAVRILSIGAVVMAVLVVGIAPTRIGLHQDSPKLAEAARRAAGTEDVEIGMTGLFTPSLVFYTGHPIHRLSKPEQVAEFFAQHPQGFVVTRDANLDAVRATTPGLVEIARHRRFLRRHDVVLIGRPPEIAATSLDSRR